MADIYSPKKRSQIMQKVKNKNTSPELIIRKILCSLGYNHYRLHSNKLPCNPDIIFPGKKKVLFVNGCFWHGHDCNRGHLPKTNFEFWQKKISLNKERDKKEYGELNKIGWKYLVIWQCEIKAKQKEALINKLKDFMENQ